MISRISGANFNPSFGSVVIFKSEYEKVPMQNFRDDVFAPLPIDDVKFARLSVAEEPYYLRQAWNPKENQAYIVEVPGDNRIRIITDDLVTEALITKAIRDNGYSKSARLEDDFSKPIEPLLAEMKRRPYGTTKYEQPPVIAPQLSAKEVRALPTEPIFDVEA